MGRLREIIFTARLIDYEEAQLIGLVSEVFDDAQSVRERATELAKLIGSHAPKTLQATKESMRRLCHDGPKADGSDIIIDTYMSQDFKEGIEAFLSKRKPEWKGQ